MQLLHLLVHLVDNGAQSIQILFGRGEVWVSAGEGEAAHCGVVLCERAHEFLLEVSAVVAPLDHLVFVEVDVDESALALHDGAHLFSQLGALHFLQTAFEVLDGFHETGFLLLHALVQLRGLGAIGAQLLLHGQNEPGLSLFAALLEIGALPVREFSVCEMSRQIEEASHQLFFVFLESGALFAGQAGARDLREIEGFAQDFAVNRDIAAQLPKVRFFGRVGLARPLPGLLREHDYFALW